MILRSYTLILILALFLILLSPCSAQVSNPTISSWPGGWLESHEGTAENYIFNYHPGTGVGGSLSMRVQVDGINKYAAGEGYQTAYQYVDVTGWDKLTFYATYSGYTETNRGGHAKVSIGSQSIYLDVATLEYYEIPVSGYGVQLLEFESYMWDNEGMYNGASVIYADNIYLTGYDAGENSINFNPDVEISVDVPSSFDFELDVNYSPCFSNYVIKRECMEMGEWPVNYTYCVDDFLGLLEHSSGTLSCDGWEYGGDDASHELLQVEEVTLFLMSFEPCCLCTKAYGYPTFDEGIILDYVSIEINDTYEAPIVPLPTTIPTPMPTATPTPIPTPIPNPGVPDDPDNDTAGEINSSLMDGYYGAVDGVFGNLSNTTEGTASWMVSPVTDLTDNINTLNESINTSFSQSVGHKSVLLSVTIPFFANFPTEFKALISLALVFIIVLLVLGCNFRGQ